MGRTEAERDAERVKTDEFVTLFVRFAVLWIAASIPVVALVLWAYAGHPQPGSIGLALVGSFAVAGYFWER